MFWGTLGFLHVPQVCPGTEALTFSPQLQPKYLWINFILGWHVNSFWPKISNSKTLNNQKAWKPSHFMQLVLYLRKPELPKKRKQCEGRLAFRSLLPPVQWSFYPSDMQPKGSSSLLWVALLWPHHRPTKQCYNTELKSKGKPEKNRPHFKYWLTLLPFVPQIYLSWFGHRLASVSCTSHFTSLDFRFIKFALTFSSESSLERKGDLRPNPLGDYYLTPPLWHTLGDRWQLPSTVSLNSRMSFLEKPSR